MNKKEIYVNLNFDDFNPQFNGDGDFAGLEGENLARILKLLNDFPGLKITMFTVPNWIDRPQKKHRYLYKLREILRVYPVIKPDLTQSNLLSKNPKWCEVVRNLVSEDRLEIANHGYFHFNPFSSVHGQEFANLTKEQTRQRILLAEEEFKKNGISFIKAFRPPGWGINEYLEDTLRDLDYKIYAPLSSGSKTCKFLRGGNGLFVLPQNWSIKENKEEAIKLAEECGYVFMKGHIAYNYGNEIIENGINKKNWDNLISALRELEKRYHVNYVSLEELLKHQK